MPKSRRPVPGCLAACAVTAAALTAGVVPAAAADPASGNLVRSADCSVVLANPEVPADRVTPLLPDGIRVRENTPGMATLLFQAQHCERLTVNGTTRETLFGAFRVDVDLGAGHTDQATHFDFFQFWLVSDNPELVAFLRAEGAAANTVVYVEHLRFTSSGADSFVFEAPAPTPSPYVITARVEPALAGPLDRVTGHHYAVVPGGLMTIGVPEDVIRSVSFGAAAGTVKVQPGSGAATLLCATEATFANPGFGRADYDTGWFAVGVEPGRHRTPDPPPCPAP